MPRPRTFDEDRALDAAVRTFWRHGYEATSTEDLCAVTGLGRSSLDNTFHSKPPLYEAALACYVHERTTRMIAVLEGEGTGRERLAAIVQAASHPDPDDPGPRHDRGPRPSAPLTPVRPDALMAASVRAIFR